MTLDEQLALLENEENELKRRRAQLIELRNEENRLKAIEAAKNKPATVSIKLAGPMLSYTTSLYRIDLAETLSSILNTYSGNTFSIDLLEPLEIELAKLANVKVDISDITRKQIEKIKKGIAFELWDTGRGIGILANPGSNIWEVQRAIPNYVIPAGKSNQVIIQRADAHLVDKLLEDWSRRGIKYEVADPKLIEFIKSEAENKAMLLKIAELEDVEYPVTLANGYEERNFQRVGSLFSDLAGRCIIADPMGMGKTIQAIAVAEKNNCKTLIACPAFLVLNWIKYIEDYTGKTPYVMEGTTPEAYNYTDMLLNGRQYNIIHYDAIARPIKIDNPDKNAKFEDRIIERNLWIELFNNPAIGHFDLAIVDEGHYIKNMNSSRSKAIRQLKATRFIFLTGTPLLNRPAELFPMLNTLRPELFPSYKGFMDTYSDGRNGARNVEQLRTLLANVMIRRKNPRLAEMPDIPVYLKLSTEAKKKYDKIMQGIYEDTKGNTFDIVNILAQITRMKQVCAHDKITSTVEQAIDSQESFDEDDKHNGVLIFSYFVDVCEQIHNELGHDHSVLITGHHTPDMGERYKLVKKFQEDPKYKYIVVNVAAKEGLNITKAGAVIYNDLLWTGEDHKQIKGRAFGREGDFHGGNSFWMLNNGTIEDWIYTLIQEKELTVNQVADGERLDEEYNESSVAMAIINRIKRGGM